jgi:hypothetical protein
MAGQIQAGRGSDAFALWVFYLLFFLFFSPFFSFSSFSFTGEASTLASLAFACVKDS